MGRRYPLTRCELEVMNIVWSRGEATVQEVCDALPRPLAYTTVMTVLSLLCVKKKVLSRTKRGRAYVYRPLVSREEISQATMEELGDVLFGERLPSLILNLIEERSLSQKDIDALKAAIEKLEASS